MFFKGKVKGKIEKLKNNDVATQHQLLWCEIDLGRDSTRFRDDPIAVQELI